MSELKTFQGEILQNDTEYHIFVCKSCTFYFSALLLDQD